MCTASPTVRRLIERGVEFTAPGAAEAGPEVDPERIAPGVRVCGASRLLGASLSIGPGCVLGEETPLTLQDCQLGERVRLKGGYCAEAVFLDGAEAGSGAHVRPGTLIEEQASCAHTVGLKQTILMPYSVLGSLINFCDCLLSGGTSRRNHSEVGSAYVHFNFTPHQDKATPSLFGDVPRGVMLQEPPIFLGGQGGAVGPLRVAFGTVIAAGTVQRRDVTEPGRLVCGPLQRGAGELPFEPGHYGQIGRVLAHNFAYIGNLHALHAWYVHVRAVFMRATPWHRAAHAGALALLRAALAERLRRLDELAARMPRSLALARRRLGANLPEPPYGLQARFGERWSALAHRLTLDALPPPALPDGVAEEIASLEDAVYLDAMRRLLPESRQAGTDWLQGIVDRVVAAAREGLDAPTA